PPIGSRQAPHAGTESDRLALLAWTTIGPGCQARDGAYFCASTYRESGIYSPPCSFLSSPISCHPGTRLEVQDSTATSRYPTAVRMCGNEMRSYIHWCVSPR